MNPSKNLIDKLKDWEGCELTSYQDGGGVWTVGVGSTMYRSGKRVGPNETITPEMADTLLMWELSNKAAVINGLIPKTRLTQNQFDAILSFVFNCGVGAFAKSTLLKKVIQNPNDTTIADAFLMYNKIRINGALQVSKGLTSRRKKEWALYSS